MPDDGVSYPPAAAAFFLAEAQHLGAKLFPVRALSAANGEVQIANGMCLSADRIVLAVGTECDLLPALPVKKRKGHLVLTDRYPDFIHHQLVELGYLKSAHKVAVDSVAFNIQPRISGQLVIGSSRQYGSEDPAVEPVMLKQMMDRAKEYMPKFAESIHPTRMGGLPSSDCQTNCRLSALPSESRTIPHYGLPSASKAWELQALSARPSFLWTESWPRNRRSTPLHIFRREWPGGTNAKHKNLNSLRRIDELVRCIARNDNPI